MCLKTVYVCAVFSVGPCALEYTKLKTSDHFWTDPSANELVQRHRIHGAHRGQDVLAGRRPALGVSTGHPPEVLFCGGVVLRIDHRRV